MELCLLFHMTATKMNETILYVGQSPPSTLRQATLNLFFFPKQKNVSSHYQTKLQQYHLTFRNLLLYIFFLKTFEGHLKTNNPNPLFHKFLQLFQILRHLLKFHLFFFFTKIGKGTPQTLCLDTHQSGLVSIIDFSLSLPLLG